MERRQIIKTRSQRPYVIARIILVAIVVMTIVIAIAYAVAERRARTHNTSWSPPRVQLQDSIYGRLKLNMPISPHTED